VEVAEPPEVVEEPLFWLGEVMECFLFVIVAGFYRVVDLDGKCL
jgi:hypothetical protein